MKLKKGVNIGGYLSQCNYEKEHYDSFIGEADVKKVSEMGFDHMRLPVDACVLTTEEGEVIESGFAYVDRMVDWAEKYGLDIIIDLHKAYGYDFNDAGTEANSLFSDQVSMDRLNDLWSLIAKRYGKRENVAFELLNEVVESELADPWNALSKRLIRTIRKESEAPVIYGGIQWNSAMTVKLLEKPEFDNVIYTFHFYEPLIFTHQKAYWVKNMDMERTVHYPATLDYYKEVSETLGYQGEAAVKTNADSMGTSFIEEMITDALQAANKNGVRLYCGEFGVIDQAPVEDTLRWFRDVDEVFRKYDIGFSVWSFKKMDFGITDEHYAPIIDELCKLWNE
ncbi:MAG: cellulase family glycosylhydrolase [Lachnospiraceae bacterium]|nr:cellulase family glycosylhydrolase [Lachnospiraceae bacterium]